MTISRFPKTYKTLACLVGMLTMAGALWAQTPTRLQVLATSDQQKAQMAAQQLNELGAGPAEVRPSGGLFKVLTRSYASLAEANFAKPAIKGGGFSDAFAVSDGASQAAPAASTFGDVPSITTQFAFEQSRFDFKVATPKRRAARITPALEALDNEKASREQLLAKALGYYKPSHADAAVAALEAYVQRFPASADVAQAKLMKGYWLVEKGDLEGARLQFEALASQHSQTPEAGEATLRLAYLSLRAQRDGEALQKFYAVAAAKIPAAEEVRVEAILRTAALFHRGRDLQSADQAYQVVADSASDAQVRAFAQMQRAGLALELAWNQKATFAGARAKCDEVLERYPHADKSIRATAALMALETLSYEGKYSEMLDREKAFLDEFSQTNEATLGFYWLAKARLQTGDAKGAAAILESLIAAQFPSEQRFKHVEVTSQARRLAARAYEKLGNAARAKALLDEMRAEGK